MFDNLHLPLMFNKLWSLVVETYKRANYNTVMEIDKLPQAQEERICHTPTISFTT